METQKPPRLSIVIPAYNEEERIGSSLARIVQYLVSQSFTWEIVLVDDGSTDQTAAVARRVSAELGCGCLQIVQHAPNRGKGYAVREGMLRAAGGYVLMCDADLATPIEELAGFWRFVEEGYDIVIASRPLPQSQLLARQPLYRELGGRTLNLLIRALAVPGIRDTQCGFKLFRREAVQRIFPICTLDGFGFDIEVLHIAQKFGLRIREVPVRWYHLPGSKVRPFRDGFRMLADIYRVHRRHRRLEAGDNHAPR